MGPRLLIIFALSLHIFLASTIPLDTRQLSLVAENTLSITQPTALPPHEVKCLDMPDHYHLVASDCGFVLNDLILRDQNVFEERKFMNRIYRSDAGGNAQARWWYDTCEVTVHGSKRNRPLWMSFFDVALTAQKIISQCVDGVKDPGGGVSIVGDVELGFAITVRGSGYHNRVSAKNDSVSHQPLVNVSKRAI